MIIHPTGHTSPTCAGNDIDTTTPSSGASLGWCEEVCPLPTLSTPSGLGCLPAVASERVSPRACCLHQRRVPSMPQHTLAGDAERCCGSRCFSAQRKKSSVTQRPRVRRLAPRTRTPHQRADASHTSKQRPAPISGCGATPLSCALDSPLFRLWTEFDHVLIGISIPLSNTVSTSPRIPVPLERWVLCLAPANVDSR